MDYSFYVWRVLLYLHCNLFCRKNPVFIIYLKYTYKYVYILLYIISRILLFVRLLNRGRFNGSVFIFLPVIKCNYFEYRNDRFRNVFCGLSLSKARFTIIPCSFREILNDNICPIPKPWMVSSNFKTLTASVVRWNFYLKTVTFYLVDASDYFW